MNSDRSAAAQIVEERQETGVKLVEDYNSPYLFVREEIFHDIRRRGMRKKSWKKYNDDEETRIEILLLLKHTRRFLIRLNETLMN